MLRWLAFAGPLVEALAIGEQLRWHARMGDVERFDSFLLAHAGIYAGVLVGVAGLFAWRREARWRGAATLALAGAGVRLIALVADTILHRANVEALAAHDLYRFGIAVALVGLALGASRLLAALRDAAAERAEA